MKHPSAYRKSAATGSDHSGLKKQKGVNMGKIMAAYSQAHPSPFRWMTYRQRKALKCET